MCDSQQMRVPLAPGEIIHIYDLSENMRTLLTNLEFTDVTLIVEGKEYKAHKIILAARSQYFRALLYGGMKESSSNIVELKETRADSFKYLLFYIYTGKLTLHDLKEETILEILGQSHQYGFQSLENSISEYLKSVLDTKNVCTIYDLALIYDLPALQESCTQLMDCKATDVMKTDAFKQLSRTAILSILERDSFYADELAIFESLDGWWQTNNHEKVEGLLKKAVRLPLIEQEHLLKRLRKSRLITDEVIVDTLAKKLEKAKMPYRGYLLPDANIATPDFGAQVTNGDMRCCVLDGDTTNYDLDRGFTRHSIEPSDPVNNSIVISLGKPSIINAIRLLLWDKDFRSYSYYIECSVNGEDWELVVDRKKYYCRSWQNLRFEKRVVKLVRIVGSHNTVNRVFHLVAFECMYSTASCELKNGIPVAKYNVATLEECACVVEGVSRSRNALINGDTRNYDWDSGYTCHQLGSGAIIVQLAGPNYISSMRLLLWDCDNRAYSYRIEVSAEGDNWHTVCDRSQEACRSWQIVTFEPVIVTFVRIIGTHNTANEVFHCVHFEAPSDAQALKEYLERSKEDSNAPPLTPFGPMPQPHPQQTQSGPQMPIGITP